MIAKNQSQNESYCFSTALVCLVMFAMAVLPVISHAETGQLSSCQGGILESSAGRIDDLKAAESLSSRAQELFERGDKICGEKVIQKVNGLAAPSKDVGIQARIFLLAKDVLLATLVGEADSAEQKAKRVALGLQHKAVLHPAPNDYFADVAFLVKAAELIDPKRTTCEGARLYLEAAGLEQQLPADHSRFIETLGLQKEIERDAQGWCFSEIAGIAKTISITHPDIKINKIMGRIVRFAFPPQHHLIRKTDKTDVQKRLASIEVLRKYISDAEPFSMECSICGKDSRPILVGLLEEVSGFLEMAREDNDQSMRHFNKGFRSYGLQPEAAGRSWHRLVLASQLMYSGIDLNYVAKLFLEAREDVVAMANDKLYPERVQMYNRFINQLRYDLKMKNIPIPEKLVPIPVG